MKRLLYFVVFLLIALCGQSQTINQKGVTYRYNGKNKRTPIGGVYIKAVTANNGEVSNEKTGAFELALNNLRMGSRIGNVRVTKQGMMVFNQQAVDEWSVRKDPLCLILCNADEFQRQKKNLIAIGERQAQKKYEKKLAELKKQNDAKQLQIDDYYNKLDSLENEYQNALKHMDEYADVFARIDESEADTVTQRAIELFHRGEIEESLRLLEGQHYMEKIGKALRTIHQADAMISTAEQAKSLAEQDKEKYLEGVRTQIAGYKLQNEWDKAAALLKGLADTLQTKEAIEEYAYFALNQKMYKEAETYYLKYKEILERLAQSNPQAYEPDLAMSYNNLAILYSDTQRFSDSEAMYKQSLEICERLAKSNPQAYEPDLAQSYYNLAILYSDTQRFSESEAMHKQALEICEHLAQSNPQAYEPYLAGSYNNLANLYYRTQHFAESEAMHKQALEILERLAQSNPQAYEPSLAISYNNLASLYSDTQRFTESEAMHKQALAIRERLAQSNPQAYEPDLAMSYNNLANLYYRTQHFAESEAMHKQAIAIRERLAQSNSQAYEPSLAKSYNNLANLYSDIQRFSESEAMHKQAIEIRKRLAQSNPQAYEPDLAQSYNNLALLYSDIQRFAESEAMHKQALAIYERLAQSNPQAYAPDLAMSYNNLASLYYQIQRFAESEAMCKQALAIYERLAQSNPQAYEPDLAQSYNNLALLYSDTQRFSESEAMYKQALAIYERFAQSNPQFYETQLMESYYWLGRTMLLEEKYHEAQEQFKKSLHLARKQIKVGTETSLYWENLYCLSFISAKEKDYTSAYTYKEELLPLMNTMYQKDTEDWMAAYSGLLVSQSFYANLLGKFKEGEQYSLEAIKVDSTKHMAYTSLAAALLFQGKVEKAENLYRQYKAEFKESFLDDFAEYERLNVIPEERKKDVERIKAMLKE